MMVRAEIPLVRLLNTSHIVIQLCWAVQQFEANLQCKWMQAAPRDHSGGGGRAKSCLVILFSDARQCIGTLRMLGVSIQ